jgi:Flp pilus assembly protein TadG
MQYELYHAGVKGMKWGVRKAQKKALRVERRAQKQADRDARRAAAGRTKTKGKRMAGRIVAGVATNIGIGMLGSAAQSALRSRGSYAVAEMLNYGMIGAAAANVGMTVRDTVNIGRDKRDRW